MGQIQKKFSDDVDVEIYNLNAKELVCSHHIKDDFIKKYIQTNGYKGKCNYCNTTKKIIDLSEVLKLIVTGVECLFEDANDSRYYNKEGEHGFDGDTKLFYDLYYDDDLDLKIDNYQLQEDIFNYLNNYQIVYCRKDEYSGEFDYLKGLWDYFKELVKHKARFVFHFKNTFSDYFYHNPAGILESVQQYILELNLFKTISTNEKLYRCVQHKLEKEVKDNGKRIASNPIPNCKRNNRMSPPGISMFYCSPYKDICVSEVVDYDNASRPYYTTAYFTPRRDLKLVDLTNLPTIPSIFDKENNKHRVILFFLKEFIKDATKPINKDYEVIDYVPTQIVTEYIKYNPKLKVDGILYPSSKDSKKEDCVLFMNHEESLKELIFVSESKETNKIYA